MTTPNKNTACAHCSYTWNTRSKLKMITCPSCAQKTENPHATKDVIYDCMRECYLNSEPSIDIATAKKTISPYAHTIKLSIFDAILKKHNCKISGSLMVFLNKGPKIVQG